MKYYFIINPVAGKLDATKDITPELRRTARMAGIAEKDLFIQKTQRPGHATVLARQAAQSGEAVKIYAVGGDGTFNETLRGAMPYPNAAVGLIPCGSGNDFLRNFGTKEEFRDLRDQFKSQPMTIDMIQTDNSYAAAICSAGLDAQVAYGIPKFRRVPFCHSEMAYKLSIVQSLLGKRSTKLNITVDGQEYERECLMVAICNGCAYGGGFIAAPEARLDDGLMDVLIVHKMPLVRIAQVLPTYQAGKHIKNGEIIPELEGKLEFFRAKKVSLHTADPKENIIINIDGECGPRTELNAAIVPMSARILLPSKVYQRYQSKQSCEEN